MCHAIQTCSLTLTAYLASLTYSIVTFSYKLTKIYGIGLHFTSIKSMFIVFVNETIGLPVFPA